MACRHFTSEEYIDADKHLTAARTALQQREEKLQEAFSYIERDLQLLGATGVEDKYAPLTGIHKNLALPFFFFKTGQEVRLDPNISPINPNLFNLPGISLTVGTHV